MGSTLAVTPGTVAFGGEVSGSKANKASLRSKAP